MNSEDVFYSFAVEPSHDQSTLNRYLQDYPEYADELVSLSHELSKEVSEDDSPLSGNDLALIEKS